jgi:hypothetical protein
VLLVAVVDEAANPLTVTTWPAVKVLGSKNVTEYRKFVGSGVETEHFGDEGLERLRVLLSGHTRKLLILPPAVPVVGFATAPVSTTVE